MKKVLEIIAKTTVQDNYANAKVAFLLLSEVHVSKNTNISYYNHLFSLQPLLLLMYMYITCKVTYFTLKK